MSFEKSPFHLRISPSEKLSMMLIGALIKVRGVRDMPPNPAVERACAKSRAGRSLLRWAS